MGGWRGRLDTNFKVIQVFDRLSLLRGKENRTEILNLINS